MTSRPSYLLVSIATAAIAACADGTAPSNDAAVRMEMTPNTSHDAVSVSVSVYATGLQFPRGMTFGPGGALYVGEAGLGGNATTTAQQCTQVTPPIGPYRNGPTARISRIDRDGNRTTFAQGFPSSVNALGDVTGVSDLAFQGGKLFALLAGGGCDHGSPAVPALVTEVASDGSWAVVANLTAYQAANAVAHPPTGDFEPSGSWYSMIQSGSSLIAVEPNHGEVVRVDPNAGTVSRIVDVSAPFGHVVPTVIAERSGDYYLSALGTFPVVPGTQSIYRVSRSGSIEVVASGFTTVLGLDFDRSGDLYVLESSPAPGFPTPMTGRVVRLGKHGGRDVIVSGLFFPTALRVGPDDALYISNNGFGPPIPGQILRVEVHE